MAPLNDIAGWKDGAEGELASGILFVDLMSSSDFASVLGLRDYAEYVQGFQSLCLRQTHWFFNEYLKDSYGANPLHWRIEQAGDELVVMLNSPKPHNDVYQLICLSLALRCAWLGSAINLERVRSGFPSTQLAAGLHWGRVWARRTPKGISSWGFIINVAKRIEGISRRGEHLQIFVGEPALRLLGRRARNLLFVPPARVELKGVLTPYRASELRCAFLDPLSRLAPEFHESFLQAAELSIASNCADPWVLGCLLAAREKLTGRVEDDSLQLAEYRLHFDPEDAVALYYAGLGHQQRGRIDLAQKHWESLCSVAPNLSDGWIELGKLHRARGNEQRARECFLSAECHGANPTEWA